MGFTDRAKRSGLVPSMGSIGDCYDNAKIESFWGRMQTELLKPQTLEDEDRAGQCNLRLSGDLPQPPTPPFRPRDAHSVLSVCGCECTQDVNTHRRNCLNRTNACLGERPANCRFQQRAQRTSNPTNGQIDGLKIRTVSVRVRLGARRNCLVRGDFGGV
jgi:hypothetical protein